MKYIVIAILVFGFMVGLSAALKNYEPENYSSLTPGQAGEAETLAANSFVTHKDGTITRLSQKDAEMMVETCSMLKDVKLSDMTPAMLSVWDTCRSHGIGR